jgi:hypothetical protein
MIVWKEVSVYTGREIEEDAPASGMGGGNIAGGGIDHPDRPGSGEPGKKKKKREVMTREEIKMDARTKSYRTHRAKLETSRTKRLERKNTSKSKFIENIKKKTKDQKYNA